MSGPLVATPDEAVTAVGLPVGAPVGKLSPAEWEAFGRLVGWTDGGPVVAMPIPAEQAARADRQAWKGARQSVSGRCLLLDEEALHHARQRLRSDTAAAEFGQRLRTRATAVAAIGPARLEALIPAHAPWNTAGSYCPHCLGTRSAAAIHAPFWRWRVDEPDRIQCPHCQITYPHVDYAEHGRLRLPRLGIHYDYYLSPAQRARDGGRSGIGASSFGGGPTHVSLSGEVERCALNWLLGQLEPLALAAVLFEEPAWGKLVGGLLERLAAVFDHYPIYSYRQEYADCDPAFAVQHLNNLPTPLKRAACRYTYCGSFGDEQNLHGLGASTTSHCIMPNGEWGAARLAREKASHGQLFMSLLQAYDLVREGLPASQCQRIEQDLLLEYYLDVEGLTQRVDNKSGPGAAARVAVGVMFDDGVCLEAGVERFEAILYGQFYDDGSWRETPIYGAKALVEGLWQVPEMLRRRQDLYVDGVLRRALTIYAKVATPLGTQPSLDDSAVDFGLSPHLVDLARLRLGIDIPLAPTRLSGLRLNAPAQRLGFAGYVPRWEMALVDDEDRLPGDGGLGFTAVGHHARPQPDHSWVRHVLGGDERPAPSRPALQQFFRGRGLVCVGVGQGPDAAQAYLDGGDGGQRHRHLAPLGLSLFAAGIEIFPDLGYIADHPANAWIRTTASHNGPVIDGQPTRATNRCRLLECWRAAGMARTHVETDLVCAREIHHRGQRRLTFLAPHDGWPLILLDELLVCGPGRVDHVLRVNADPADFRSDRVWTETAPVWDLPFEPSRAHWQQGGAVVSGSTWHWPTSIGWVSAVALSASPAIARFRAPAWRTYAEIQAAPAADWLSVAVRQPPHEAVRMLYFIGADDPVRSPMDGPSLSTAATGSRPMGLQVEPMDNSIALDRPGGPGAIAAQRVLNLPTPLSSL